jgi:hypothetical protein
MVLHGGLDRHTGNGVSIAAATFVFDSKHTDRIVEVEPIAVPIGSESNRGYADAGMAFLERAVWSRERRHRRNLLSIRAEEDELARLRTSNDELLVVEHAMVAAAQQDEVLELRFATMNPMAPMMSVCSTVAAAGKAATPIAFFQRSTQGVVDTAGLTAEVEDATFGVVQHHDRGCIAEDASQCAGI